jgi:SAM-dependent methyltransferase
MAKFSALSRQFDDAAQLYDEVRPRYPEAIVEHIIAFAELPAHGRIFEVDCGIGRMTLPFAQRGYAMVALDQGKRLAALAAQPTYTPPPPGINLTPLPHASNRL